jgi:PAS domain S-box-containing protein
MLLNHSNDAIVMCDLLGKILEINQVVCEYTGYSREELLYKSVRIILSPEFVKKIPFQIRDLKHTGRSVCESVARCKDGSTIPIELSNRLVEYAGKRVIISVARDITEREQSLNALRDSEQKLKLIYEHANDGIYVQDLNGKILEVNEIACQQMGYSRDEFIGVSVEKLSTSEADAKKIMKQILDRSQYIFETNGVCKDGSYIPLEISSRVIEHDGKPALLSISRDITERKRVENELLYAKLEADASNRAKSDFMTAMSHELRTPLNSIIGFSDILLDTDCSVPAEKQLKYVQFINDSGNKLLRMINELLEISEIESEKLELHISDFLLHDALEEVLAGLNPKITRKNIHLVCAIDDGLGIIKVDRNKFKHIMFNLIDNAIKFNVENGSITIEITNNNSFMQISIKDTGIGISVENLQDIFLPFKQIDSGINREHAGCGVGLVLVNNFIKLHGGGIWVKSEVNKGSTFTFTLPVRIDSTVLLLNKEYACKEKSHTS